MTILLSPRFWLFTALAVIVSLFGFFMFRAGKSAIRAEFDAYRLSQTQALQKAEAEHRAKEQEWQASADKTTKAKDEQIRSINARADKLASELRNRPSRPASGSVPASSLNGKGGTGATLYAQDSEFLIREAARADRLRAALEACYKTYDEIRGKTQ